MTIPGTPHDESLQLMQSPVAVIGAAADGILGGLTCAWLTRVSTDPPRVVVAIAPERYTYGLLVVGECFSVSILGEGQTDVGRLFGLHSRRDRDKWSETDHVLLEGGVPALAECAARLLCRLIETVPVGDHDLFVGEIIGSDVVSGPPALPMRGRDYA
jgi:flavin reductase (DIM6/NTAB) family NADH-FMN oxidoreductase RutF